MFSSSIFAILGACIVYVTTAATVRSYANYDYGGKTHQQFLQEAIERSSPGNARLLAELFGGLELGLELGSGAQAVISVGGAATRCQHQSPCFDINCNMCYDPLLRIHGVCGGASYFTCRGTLPKACMPYTCTIENQNPKTVFVKKFPRYEDPFCLGIEEKARSLDLSTLSENGTVVSPDASGRRRLTRVNGPDSPKWLMAVPDSVTPCQGYDICLDLRCGTCYDAYLGAHTSCGKLTYYDCSSNLPRECQPMRCTETNINEIFPASEIEPKLVKRQIEEQIVEMMEEMAPLMVRNFSPLEDEKQNCI